MPKIPHIDCSKFTKWGAIHKHNYTGSINHLGSASIDCSHLDQLHVSGSAHLTQSIAKAISISGTLIASDCERIGSINSAGRTHLSRCEVTDTITASGTLSLTASKVHGKVFYSGAEPEIVDSEIPALESSSPSVKISNSSIEEIVMKPTHTSYSWRINFFCWKWESVAETSTVPQTVELRGLGCKVGTIRFEIGEGTVVLKDGAAAPTVINGQIIRA